MTKSKQLLMQVFNSTPEDKPISQLSLQDISAIMLQPEISRTYRGPNGINREVKDTTQVGLKKFTPVKKA